MTTLVLLARIGAQTIAIDATAIESVTDLTTVVPVPFAAAHVHGLSALRSQVVTVIDCSRAAGCAPLPPVGRALVAEVDGHLYALRVDSVEDVVACTIVPLDRTTSAGPAWDRIATGRVDLGDRFAIAIDPVRVVNGPALQEAA